MPLFCSIEKEFPSRISAAYNITVYCHSVKEEQRLLLELAALLRGKLVIEEEQTEQQERHHLTYMENIVYMLLLDGFSCREISEKLFIDVETVRVHKKHIYEKLRVHSKAEFLKKFMPHMPDDNVAF